MSKTTKQKIAQVVLETLESAELEALEELTNAVVGLSNNVATLTSVLLRNPSVKAEPKDDAQGDLFIQLAPVVEPTKEESSPLVNQKKKPKKPAVQPEPVVESAPIEEPVVQTAPIEEPVVQPVVLMEFTELQANVQKLLDFLVQEKGPEANTEFLNLAREKFVDFKVSKLAELPEDKYHTYFQSLVRSAEDKFDIFLKGFLVQGS